MAQGRERFLQHKAEVLRLVGELPPPLADGPRELWLVVGGSLPHAGQVDPSWADLPLPDKVLRVARLEFTLDPDSEAEPVNVIQKDVPGSCNFWMDDTFTPWVIRGHGSEYLLSAWSSADSFPFFGQDLGPWGPIVHWAVHNSLGRSTQPIVCPPAPLVPLVAAIMMALSLPVPPGAVPT